MGEYLIHSNCYEKNKDNQEQDFFAHVKNYSVRLI
jgi:hypothetical protein